MKAALTVAQRLQDFVGGVDTTDNDADMRIAVLVDGSWIHGFVEYGTSRGLGVLVLSQGEVLGALPPLRFDTLHVSFENVHSVAYGVHVAGVTDEGKEVS